MSNNDHNDPKLDKVNHEVDFDNSNIDFDADGLLNDFDDASLELDVDATQSQATFGDASTSAADDPYFNSLGADGSNAFDDFGDFEEIDFNLDGDFNAQNGGIHDDFDANRIADTDSVPMSTMNNNQGYAEIDLEEDEDVLLDNANSFDNVTSHQSLGELSDMDNQGVDVYNSDGHVNGTDMHGHSTYDTDEPHDQGFDSTAETVIAPAAGVAAAVTATDTNKQVNEPVKANKASKLFGKKELKAQPAAAIKPVLKKSAKQPSSNLLKILAALVVLALLGLLAYLFLGNKDEPATTDPVTVEPTTATPAPAEPVDLATAAEQAQPVIQEPVVDAEDGDTNSDNAIATPADPATTGIAAPAKPKLTADEILNAKIPEDPALVKEEIDKLEQQEELYSQQEELLKEQIKDMETLTKDKAEHIALLEKQIAQLKAQK